MQRTRFDRGWNMMGIGWAAQNRQANITDIHIHAVFAIIEQAEPIGKLLLTRCTRYVNPAMKGSLLAVGKMLDMPVRNFVRDLHKFDVDWKTQLKQFEL